MNSLDPERMKIALDPEGVLATTFGETRVQQLDAGTLSVPSGRIAACDGFVCIDVQAFERGVTPGRYPVVLTLALLPKGPPLLALATTRFSNSPPTNWEMATCPGQFMRDLKSGEFFGYPVDSGVGCFASPEALALIAGDPAGDALFERITSRMRENAKNGPEWANVELHAGECNAVLFSSGLGDGVYGSHWGLNDAGDVVCLTTDFGLLEPPSNEPPDGADDPWFRRWMPTFFGPGPKRDEPGR